MPKMTTEERSAILQLLADGIPSDEIAQQLGISIGRVAAVKAHITMGNLSVDGSLVENLDEVVDAADLKFGLEKDMQSALRQNIHQLDSSLTIVDGGKERHVEAGYIDILAEDADGRLVVIELKAGTATDAAVTQVLSYVGSLQAEQDKPVVAILIAREFSNRVRLAARAARITLLTYGFSFTFGKL